MVTFTLGMFNVSGSPCTDYSALGKGAATFGATVLVLLTFLLVVRRDRPLVILHENVCRQPVWIFEFCLGDLYIIQHIVVSPEDFGHPIRRSHKFG